MEIHEIDITDGLNKAMFEKLEEENKRLKEQLEEAKKALCEANRMALSDETDISKIYDIVHPIIIKLNNGV